MKIAVLDSKTFGDDIDLSGFEKLGETRVFENTPNSAAAEAVGDAEIVITNKVRISRDTVMKCPGIKLICIAATGYDIIDVEACRERNIAVANVPGYSTDSVAQITLAMALYLESHMYAHMKAVRNGEYSRGDVPNYITRPAFHEITGLTWGICGCGAIGGKVAEVAKAMGCKVLGYDISAKDGIEMTDLDDLLSRSDIVSVHVPLTAETRNMISRERIAEMKDGAVLINTARGAVADENALADAVESGKLGGLGLDAYSSEPLRSDSPIFRIREMDNVCLTPHIGWSSLEARNRVVSEIIKNIEAFSAGEKRNRVD